MADGEEKRETVDKKSLKIEIAKQNWEEKGET